MALYVPKAPGVAQMMKGGARKKVKISAVKRAAHLKSKRVPLSKHQQQKLAQQKASRDKKQNIFLQKAKKRDNLAQRKKQNKRDSLGLSNVVDNYHSDVSDETLSNMADMLDEDCDYLSTNNKSRKRKVDSNDSHSVGLERDYATQSLHEKSNQKIKINLLPIKSRDGEIISRTTEADYIAKPELPKTLQEMETEEAEYADSDEDIVNIVVNQSIASKAEKKLVSTTDLLIARQHDFERQKYRIGIICSGILEKPEDKMRNFSVLFELMEEANAAGALHLLSVRRMAIVSVTELFKDILPEYRVGQVDTKMQTVRKATLERVTYENALLHQFKKFLQRLEVLTANVTKRRHDHITVQTIKMAEAAVQSMCDLLIAHPYFNYVQNIAQLLVYMLNCNFPVLRSMVYKCFCRFFVNDKKFDMTLFIVRRINHLIKTRQPNVQLECVECLLSLKIKNVNLDAEKENELKQKKLETHRLRVLSMSKKERKRRNRLTELNKELEETRAEENKQTKCHKLTEIIKMVFTIFFRVLKNDPTSKLLSIILEGLGKFAHMINVDFFVDLISVLNKILEKTELGYREQLHCINTIFVILSGQGELLNIDPMRFYQHFYRNMLAVNAGKNHDDYRIILQTMNVVLVKRRRNMSQQRLTAFIKRLVTVSMQLLPHGTLATLGIVKTTFQVTSVLDILLDMDSSVGSGKYNGDVDDPEYCNAACTALYELSMLARHYHPTVRKMAKHIAHGVPACGDGALPTDIGKLTIHELFEQFDSSEMTFNPTVPVPKQQIAPKLKKSNQSFIRSDFESEYKSLLANIKVNQSFDFYAAAQCNNL